MSEAHHERSADSHARDADTHAAPYDPNAKVEHRQCGVDLTRSAICWTSVENPTADHRRAAEEHRRRASDHRAASVALRGAEARACVGISPDDRDMSPFDRAEDIARVEPMMEAEGPKAPQRTVGAVVTFRARPGMTAEWLQRVVDCHLARSASLGHLIPEMPNCPLVPKGARATVTSTSNGFAVAIRADDLTVAQEILARARRSHGPVTTTPIQ